MKSKIITLVLILLISFGSIYAAAKVERITDYSEDSKSLEYVQKLVKAQKFEIALKEAKYQKRISKSEAEKKRWAKIELSIAEKLEDISSIVLLYKTYPDLFLPQHEDAALLLGRYLIHHDFFEEYRELAKQWVGSASDECKWFILEADALRLEGKSDAAIVLLESRSFPGGDDCPRLMRLALYYADQSPARSWQYLERAYDLNPKDADVRSLRGRFLESLSKTNYARFEYLAAYAARPDRFGYLDQLAEFYRRYGYYKMAIDAWSQALGSDRSNGIAWVKTWFWSRVSYNSNLNFQDYALPKDNALPLAGYFLSLNDGQFWDNTTLDIEVARFHELSYVCWLRALQSLKDGDELMVWGMLKTPHYRDSMDILSSELCKQLNRVLNYRNSKKIISTESYADENAGIQKHIFFDQLDIAAQEELASISNGEDWHVDEELASFMNGSNAMSGVFLANGWNRVAIELADFEQIDEKSPEWFVYGLVMALHDNRNESDAIRFAKEHSYTDKIAILLGEMLLEEGEVTQAWEILEPISYKSSEAGLRSCWVMSVYLLQNDRIDEAKEFVENRPAFYNTITAKEVLGRVEHVKGNIEQARKIYQEIADKSIHAKIFLAWYAYENNEIEKAKVYVTQVLLEMPDDLNLSKELLKVMETIDGEEAEQ